ncbi:prolyl 4-hydroxylase subunit alpha [Paraflavitalea soli]|uniref:Prolyl 4-hydroxylase subunit alpha n=1 Tax=Paraflavitalea soli TaxID=2315862 RepID=A0A3B7MJS4_9BACT|nr:2OG-Fe(II) oxygenase [Paraflavitalea soli]AXY74704.1 prolyl 4-hydroxylase subunit alpha [Paraflavitalea soli]
MENIISRILAQDWSAAENDLHINGYTLLRSVLNENECNSLVAQYQEPGLYRKTIVMERYRFGLGEYKYFKYPLPSLIQDIRQTIYTKLTGVANTWMKVLGIDQQYPPTLAGLHQLCHQHQQVNPTVLILQYGQGGHNTLHQDLYGDIFFPIQLVMFLDEPGKDYTGGEFVITQQVPRAQSKATVLTPRKGDFLLFTTNFRPQKGSKGYYRVNMKHGVSEIHSGQRHTLGIIFHDAQS